MEPDKNIDKQAKRKKDKHRDNVNYGTDRRTKRARTRSLSPRPMRANDYNRKRKLSRSRSPDAQVKNEKSGSQSQIDTNPPRVRKAKDMDMLNTRTGGAYIPPARLRMMQAQITDKSSIAYQRLAWEALKKSIHGHINKINVGNIGIIIKELLKENIVRGRGLLCRSVIQAQAASPTFTNVYAALVSAINSRFPNIGELLLKRLVIQFKRGFKRNDKPTCISSASFIAHLVNQRVAHEILALELLTLLVETPTDDSVEVAIAFLKESGQKLTEVSSKGVNAIFEMLRNILHEGQLDKRVQYMIEVMFQVWKDGFKDHPALLEELELVPEEEQFTHLLMLDDATDSQDILNVFKFDEKYEENEQKYKTLSKEILGSDAESGEEDDSEGSGDEEDDEDEEAEEQQKGVTIIDNTETNLVALRRTIYLTINSSLDFEECAHKLLKMELKPGQEVELCHMFLDCCAEQRTYEKFYGLLAQRFCNINRMYIGPFEEIFKDSYSTAHRLDTNRLRNVSKFFAHLLFTDSISWEVLECVKLNEEDTTSSSRIYIKILFQELAEYMGLKKLNDRLKDPTLQGAFLGVFPRDNPKNTRFSINFFTSIGLGGLTDELREHLKQMPKNVPAPITEINLGSDSSSSDSSSSSSESSSDSSSSDSENDSDQEKKKKADKKKRKDKQPETPTGDQDKTQNGEKWGHDGFYETYGQGARRVDTKPDRREREDNFARPRDVQRRNDDRDKHRENYYEQRSGDDNRRRTEDRTRNNEFRKSNRDERTDKHREETMRSREREDSSRSRDLVDKHHRDQSREDRNTERDNSSRRDNDKEIRRNREESKYNRNKGNCNERDSRAKKNKKDGQDSDREPIRELKDENREENEYVRYYDREITTKDLSISDDRDLDGQHSRTPKADGHKRHKIGYKRDDDYRKKRGEKESKKNAVSSDEDNDTSRRSVRGGGVDSRDKKEKRLDIVNRKKKTHSDGSDEDNSGRGREKREYEREIRKNRSDKEDRRKSKDSSDGDEDRRIHRDSRKMRKEVTSHSKRDERRRKEDEDTSDEGSKRKRDKKRKKKSEKERGDGWDIESIKSSKKKEFGSRYWAGAAPTRA